MCLTLNPNTTLKIKGANMFVHPWFKFLSGGLNHVTFKEFVHGLGKPLNL
jgi:hypothetical protein